MSGSYHTGGIMMQYTIVNCIKLKSGHKTSVTITMGPVMKVIQILTEESLLVSDEMITPHSIWGLFALAMSAIAQTVIEIQYTSSTYKLSHLENPVKLV